ncbi:MAG TPA: ABC transporter substrate-binding protein [Casimicrobiaceae bacterium]|nr:ABC transporter substrate-binding protein [Casimicrobiaceae bacterium]
MSSRRIFIRTLAAGVVGVRIGASAQPGKIYHLGYLSQPTRESVAKGVEAFVKKLRELGWIDGQNLAIEYRWAEGDAAQLPRLAAELVRDKVDVIVAPAGTAALAAKKATSTIPIVMIFPNDPVALGLVTSLRKPGGNVTGTTFTPGPEIYGKQLQLLKEAVPRASRVAFLENPADAGWSIQRPEVEAAAPALGIRLLYAKATTPEEFDGAFAAIVRERAEALLVSGSSTYLVHRKRLAELALKHRLPSMFNFREMVEAGALMAYGVNMADFVGRSAVYVDKILKGANPAELPVEQPTKFELVINLKTAKALRLTVPPSLLQRADEVIQ